jgi:hypothetical protein
MKKKANLPSIPRIKKALYADWSLRVRTRDGFKCLLCGATENLTAHHWYCSDHFSHTARYAIANGATLCYACHIRGIHPRADYVSVEKLFNILDVHSDTLLGINQLINTELTTGILRELWDAMRKRVITLGCVHSTYAYKRGGKYFLMVYAKYPVAVVGNVIREVAGVGLTEVTAITKVEDGYRYTLKRLETEV